MSQPSCLKAEPEIKFLVYVSYLNKNERLGKCCREGGKSNLRILATPILKNLDVSGVKNGRSLASMYL